MTFGKRLTTHGGQNLGHLPDSQASLEATAKSCSPHRSGAMTERSGPRGHRLTSKPVPRSGVAFGASPAEAASFNLGAEAVSTAPGDGDGGEVVKKKKVAPRAVTPAQKPITNPDSDPN